jgi:thiamine biosynthesis lipoprotein
VAAERARRITNGRFDPRILRALERLGSVAPTQPWGRPDVAAAPSDVPVVQRAARDRPLLLNAPVDLGGIGKGLALRWAATCVVDLLRPGDGVTGFLLDAGGDLVAIGTIEDRPWALAIEDPAGATSPVAATLMVPGWALATSSIRLAQWTAPDGRTVHHLIDPRTGEPAATGLLAVSVAFPDPAWAEVWSKALFIEGAGGIADLARRRGLAAWWIGEDGQLSMTPAARAMTSWVRAEAEANA